MDPSRFDEVSAKAARMTEFELNVIPLEDVNEYMREMVAKIGKMCETA